MEVYGAKGIPHVNRILSIVKMNSLFWFYHEVQPSSSFVCFRLPGFFSSKL